MQVHAYGLGNARYFSFGLSALLWPDAYLSCPSVLPVNVTAPLGEEGSWAVGRWLWALLLGDLISRTAFPLQAVP